MKEIKAYIKPHRLSNVTLALQEIKGLSGMSMMRHLRIGLLAMMVVFLGACAVPQERTYLQQYGHQGGRGQGFRMHPYRVDRETDTCVVGKINGRIAGLRVETFSADMEPGLALDVQTQDRGSVHVHLGPLWFLEHQEADLKPGDDVLIRGFCYELAGKHRLLAEEVTHKDHTLRLRDPQGRPYWEAWK